MKPVLLTIAVALALPAAAPAQESVHRPFQGPGREVFCAYVRGPDVPAQVKCQATFFTKPGDQFTELFVKRKGRARARLADRSLVDTDAPVLRYGETRRFGPLSCKASRKWEIRCKSRRSGNGIFIGRKRQGVF